MKGTAALLLIGLLACSQAINIKGHELTAEEEHEMMSYYPVHYQRAGPQSCDPAGSFPAGHSSVNTNVGVVAKISGQEQIPQGWKLLPLNKAQSVKSSLNTILTQWSIVGLLDGKLDGPGYGNVFTASYGNECGELFVQGNFDANFKGSHKWVNINNGKQAAIIGKNENWPCGAQLMNTDDATANKGALNTILTQWSIVGLLNGKIDGPGYGNVISKKYGAELGEFFVYK